MFVVSHTAHLEQNGKPLAGAWVIPTNEELMIALHIRRVLGSAL